MNGTILEHVGVEEIAETEEEKKRRIVSVRKSERSIFALMAEFARSKGGAIYKVLLLFVWCQRERERKESLCWNIFL